MFSKTGGFPLNLGLLLLSTSLSLYPSVSCTPVHGRDASSVTDSQQAFIDAGLVGSVVPTFIPSAIISPIYATNSSKGIKFSPGANLTTDQTKTQPEFWLTYDDPSFLNERFVIALIDPDAPTPDDPKFAQVRHFIGGDYVISSTQPSGTARLTNLSNALAEYVSPGPPDDSPPHRYTFLVYAQPPDFSSVAPTLVNSSTSLDAIVNFNISSFVSAAGLREPIAGTLFYEGPQNSTDAVSNGQCVIKEVDMMPTELDPEKVKEDLEKSGLVPDVVETFEPKAVLDVAFSGEESPVYVVEGGNLTVNQTALMPTFWLTYNDPSLLNQTFIVTMVDPDAPTPQNRSLAQVRHLVLADVRINGSGSEGVALLTNSTPALSEYIPPGPPAGSDPHRYTFLLWNQPPTFDRASASASFDPAAPVGFNVSQFASQNGLGQPVAGTFFFEGPDSNTGDITGATSANNGAGMRWMSGWSFLVGVVGIVLVWL